MNYEHLNTEERYAIAAMRGQSIKVAEIARRLRRHRSTIYREIDRNASAHDGNYRASHACQKASGRQKRSKRNMRYRPADFIRVERMIHHELSPEQVVERMRLEGSPTMSHETVYKWIWLDKERGGNPRIAAYQAVDEILPITSHFPSGSPESHLANTIQARR